MSGQISGRDCRAPGAPPEDSCGADQRKIDSVTAAPVRGVAISTRPAPSPPHPATRAGGARGKARAYVALMKLRVVELLLITTVPTMILAAGGWPGWGLVAATLLGGTAAAGAANAFNMVYDRDIDAVMNRTRNRPLVTGALGVRESLVFASALAVAAVLWFGLVVNWMAAAFTVLALLLYVVGYTMILKRRTPQNIVWGGTAGCMPVLIGWSAVTGSIAWEPIILFGVIFFWTPPHYWPLSMKFKNDYARAGVPMAPVVQDDATVAWHMIVHASAMVALSLLLIPVAPMGWLYGVVAVVAGAAFLASCIQLHRRARHPERGKLAAMRVFHGSITYLTVLFAAVALDPFTTRLLG